MKPNTNTTVAKAKPNGLPEIHSDPERAAKQGRFLELINSDPKPEWVKDHPMKKGLKYLPIGRIEHLLKTIYQRYEVIVIDWKIVANAIAVQVRLRVQEPVSLEWQEMDGLGAWTIQLKSGASAYDITQINSNAIQMNLPAAESEAIKDAAQKLGKIFGGDLNRADHVGFKSAYGMWDETNVQEGGAE